MALAASRRQLFTSNLVLAESHALLARRAGPGLALGVLKRIDADIIFQADVDHEEVVGLLARYDDKTFSYCDAFSFVVMDRLSIATAFTFDDDFRQLGFQVIP